MTGETNLEVLLRHMRPALRPEPCVFCTLDASDFAALPNWLLSDAIGLFRETEGVTVLLPTREAERAGLPFAATWAQITLSVHSDLLAVGFLAALTARLAGAGISVNAVSAFYHDHLFVPWERWNEALMLLADLAASAKEQRL